jgi:hypothetical protein
MEAPKGNSPKAACLQALTKAYKNNLGLEDALFNSIDDCIGCKSASTKKCSILMNEVRRGQEIINKALSALIEKIDPFWANKMGLGED